MNENAIVELENVSFIWPKDIDETISIERLSIYRHEHIFIRGDSGTGKTTLLNLLCGIHIANSGSLNVLNTDIGKLSALERDTFRGENLGVIFQQFNLLPFLSVKENITLASKFSKSPKQIKTEADQEIERLLKALDLPSNIINKKVTALSVGQQQRVAACRALYGAPPIIIADEPTSALDQNNRDRFLELLFNEANQNNSTIIFVSHDENTAKHFSRVEELSEHNLAHRK